MSRTYRKDKEGNKFKEGNPLKSTDIKYRCRCEWGTGTAKHAIEGKIVEKELKLQLKHWYEGDWHNDPRNRWELSTEEWIEQDRLFLEEQDNWKKYKQQVA